MLTEMSSEEEGSEQVDSEQEIQIRRRKTIQRLDSDEEEVEDSGIVIDSMEVSSQSSSSEESGDESEGVQSDMSDGQSEKCPICLNKFQGQAMGTPESCDHIFCLECIQEWAKNVNTCPVDRQVFHLILVRKEREGDIIRRIPLDLKEEEDEEEEDEDDVTYCEVCGACDREDRLLLCDACDLGYHCECLEPPLDSVPIDEWFCPQCAPQQLVNQAHAEVYEEVRELLANNFRPSGRVIARTRASEIVRSRIQRRRLAQVLREAQQQNTSNRNVGTVRRKRRTVKKRRKTTKSKKGAVRRRRKTTTRKRKRKSAKSRRTYRPLLPTATVKKRIAEKLGLVNPPAGEMIPRIKATGSNSCSTLPTAFSIFGHREELLHFEDSYEFDEEGDTAVARISSRAFQQNNLKAAAAIFNRSVNRNRRIVCPVPVPSTSSYDILGSILQDQTRLHSKDSPLFNRERTTTLGACKTQQRPINSPDEDRQRSSTRTPLETTRLTSHSSSQPPHNLSTVSSGHGTVAREARRNSYEDEALMSHDPMSEWQQRKKAKAKETKSTSDDDIDIYSDIETISNEGVVEDESSGDEEPEEYSVRNVQKLSPQSQECEVPVNTDSSDDELIIDEGEEQDEKTAESDSSEKVQQESWSSSPSLQATKMYNTEVEKCRPYSPTSPTSPIPMESDEAYVGQKQLENEWHPSSPEMNELQPKSPTSSDDEVQLPKSPISVDDDMQPKSPASIDDDAQLKSPVSIKSPDQSRSPASGDNEDIQQPKSPSENDDMHENKSSISVEDAMQPKSPEEMNPRSPDLEDEEEEEEAQPVSPKNNQLYSSSPEMKDDSLEGLSLSGIRPRSPHDQNEGKMNLLYMNEEKLNGNRINYLNSEVHHQGDEDDVITARLDSPISEAEEVFEEKKELDDGVEDISEDSVPEEISREVTEEQPVEEEKEEEESDEAANMANDDDDDQLVKNLPEIQDIKLVKSDVEDIDDSPPPPPPPRDLLTPTNPRTKVHQKTCPRASREAKKAEIDISWKKPSKSSKERSYRDGKPRDQNLLFRQRELKEEIKPSRKREERRSRNEDEDDKRRSESRKDSRRDDSDNRKDSRRESRREFVKDNRKESESKSRKESEKRKDDKWGRRKEKRHSSRERDERRHRHDKSRNRQVRHSDRKQDDYMHYYNEEKEVLNISMEKPERDVRKVDDNIIVEKREKHVKKNKQEEVSSQPEAKSPSPEEDIGSKEIISKDGSIIINVNYNRNTRNPPPAPVELFKKPSPSPLPPPSPVIPTPASSPEVVDLPPEPKRIRRRGVDSKRSNHRRPEVITISESDDEEDNVSARLSIPAAPPLPPLQQNVPLYENDVSQKSPECHLDFTGMFKKRVPRSPSPPSPSENESYDPCEPTSSPVPDQPKPPRDPKPPPSPERPPLPPEPEPQPKHEEVLLPPPPIPAMLAPKPSFLTPPPPPLHLAPFMPRPMPAPLQWSLSKPGQPPYTMLFPATANQMVMQGNFIHSMPGHLPHHLTGAPPSNMGGLIPMRPQPEMMMLRHPTGPIAATALLPTPPNNLRPISLPDVTQPPPRLADLNHLRTTEVPTVTIACSVPQYNQPSMEITNDVVDMEVDSPYSPVDSCGASPAPDSPPPMATSSPNPPPKDAFDALLAAVPKLLEDKRTRDLLVAGAAKVSKLSRHRGNAKGGAETKKKSSKHKMKKYSQKKEVAVKMNESQLKIIDDLPSSAVEMQVKEKFLKKLNRQERVVEEVKLSLKPFYNKRNISKEDYKAILRKCVPKICHNKSGEINPVKIKAMVDTYVRKYRHMKRKKFES